MTADASLGQDLSPGNELPPLRVLVVDDEPLARRRLKQLLASRADAVVAGEAENGREALRQIEMLAPDLVFLDVQMPGQSGVDVVRGTGPEQMPPVIFVTAYDQYALDAFELAALDYLVKPFDDERFEAAFERARRRVHTQRKGEAADRLMHLLQRDNASGEHPAADGPSAAEGAPDYLERIAVETPGRLRVISVEDIDYIRADGSYAEVYTAGGASHPIRERMKTLAERLDPAVFFRIHRSAIVRLDRIASLLRKGGGRYAVELEEDGTRLPVSRSRYDDLQERLGL